MTMAPVGCTASHPVDSLPLYHLFCRACRDALRIMDRSAAGDEADLARVADSLAATVRELDREQRQVAGAASAEVCERIQYALVALIDECMVFRNWPASEAWSSMPMELRLFGTRQAGEKIPNMIREVAEQQDPMQRDLAAILLACLLLGFRGRLRNAGGEACVAAWLQELHRLAFGHESCEAMIRPTIERSSDEPVQRHPLREVMPDGTRLALILCGCLILLAGLSEVLWLDIGRRMGTRLDTVGIDAPASAKPFAGDANGEHIR